MTKSGHFFNPGHNYLGLLVRERFKKKLTNLSFAFTHTYTLGKTNIFGFFPPALLIESMIYKLEVSTLN